MLKIVLICFGCFLIYVILGAILPFAFAKSKTGNMTHELASFYEPSNLKERAALVEENEMYFDTIEHDRGGKRRDYTVHI